MRKNISSINKLLISIFLLFLSLLYNPTYTFAQNADVDDDALSRILCIVLKQGKCDGAGPVPDINQPTPPNPTPEILPTVNPAPPGSCANPGGSYQCGSRSTPRSNCGHCGLNYNSYEKIWSCNIGNRAETWGTAYAIDISMSPGQAILLPSIEGQNVSWYHADEKRYITNSIQRYQGIANGKTYILQFHHTRRGSGIGLKTRAQSGQPGGYVCPSCDHVHIQIAQNGWKDATKYYCN